MKIGQEVFVTYLHDNKNPFTAKVDYVGKMYFTLTGLNSVKFKVSDLDQKQTHTGGWGQTYKVWLDKSDYEADQELKRLKQLLIKKIPLLNSQTIHAMLKLIEVNP